MAQRPGSPLGADFRAPPCKPDASTGEARSTSNPEVGDLTRKQVRERLLNDQGSIRELARRYSVNPKTVVRWRREASIDRKYLPNQRALTIDEETTVVALRMSMLLPLDDCLHILRTKIPHLTRSTLHRCFQRHGISRLQLSGERASWTQGTRRGRIGSFVMNHTAMRCIDGDFFIVSATDIYSKVIFSRNYQQISVAEITDFLEGISSFIPYRISAILIGDAKLIAAFFDGGWIKQVSAAFPSILFTRWSEESGQAPADASHIHAFEALMEDDEYIHSNVTVTEVISKINLAQVDYYNGVRLKSLRGMTPKTYVHSVWRQHPELFFRRPD